ncbi:hypothetical protein BIBE0010001c01_00006 [Bifidobacterium phage BigBern1]|nr:hypothetical protein BIBE0010001c01_00006 [Bifidobacterium phage BigBern1]
MRIVKYRPKYWLIVLWAVTMMLVGISIGLALSSYEWLTALMGLGFGIAMCTLIVACIAGSYVTTIGVPADVGPGMKATTLREES